ncbi:NAD-dependent succinate-semialdehyde dehydrogenase [Lysinibacillus telephonicus]|uniref:NAD-dependent succinate-semialdehyde dehydrogenase n=1 Tax=Lysinibacillus telephonicus TaxID=1714840 RepID=A0A3S0J508_9BACI|nr:NAD-dependent succinate-semialdehyde dehydrogenase [Lysinibacillus telephonicus]RTQ95095.1 NAD-dependent succinate-semialdehyde dehydrogenase [Lysinibacillus telephonicus]
MKTSRGIIINGKSVEASETIKVINPATKEVLGSVPKGNAKEARLAADAAYNALDSWSKLTAEQRSKLLVNWHQLIDENKEIIGEIMTKEQGKPLQEAIGEVEYANSFISWYAEEGKRIYGQTVPPSSLVKRLLILKQPVGVVAAITPWNFPAAMITRKVAPALAAGCTVVIKPASQTPFTAIRLVELAHQAGIPEGVINIVTGNASAIVSEWMNDSRVRKVTFTGSTEIGKELMKQAAGTVKKISLELGGHAPFIITKNANLQLAAEHLIKSKFRNAGQTCVCANRIYVHKEIVEEFSKLFVEKVEKLKIGNGLDQGVVIGPLIDGNAINKVKEQLQDAVEKGAKILTGGNEVNELSGYFLEPTVITNVTDEMQCMSEETFGPLAPITTFESNEEVIQRANDTPFGLAAYVFSEKLSEAIYISENLEYGIVGLNDGMPSVAQAPFGGYKESGLGREGGLWGIEEFLEIKYISVGLE